MHTPTDIANLALDAIGSDYTLGDIEDGTKHAQVCLRAYPECRTRLLRGAHWLFARKQVDLLLLGDATGQTTGVSTAVIKPWVYEYAYPSDGLAVRFIPHRSQNVGYPPGNYAISSAPLYQNVQNSALYGERLHPSRFLISRDVNYPPPLGQLYDLVQGVSPQGRTVICSNVKNAMCIYTSDVIYPSEWDALFRDAMISYLAQAIVLKLEDDKRLATELRKEQILITKDKLANARVANGNEAWTSTDHMPDFIKVRFGGGGWRGAAWGSDFEGGFCGWSSVSFADGSAY